ncbi:MAG: hypothetical protein ABIJ15_05450 [bacterium]
MKYLIFRIFLCLVLSQTIGYTQNKVASYYLERITTCRFLKDGKPYEITASFATYEKFYVFTSWQNVKGTHTAESYWYDPQDKLRSVVPVSFESKNGIYNTWFWFKVGHSGNLAMALWTDEGWESIGKWHVDIYLDDKFIQKLDFTVG